MTRAQFVEVDFGDSSTYRLPWWDQLGWTLEDAEFIRCRWRRADVEALCGATMPQRPRLRNVNVVDADFPTNMFLVGAVLEEVWFHGMTSGFPAFSLCAFRHARFSGRFRRLHLGLGVPNPDSRRQALLADHNRDFHRDVDWTIDIADAVVTELASYPFASANLVDTKTVVIDPTRQALLSAASVGVDADHVECSHPVIAEMMRLIVKGSYPPDAILYIGSDENDDQADEITALVMDLHERGMTLPTRERS